MRYKYEIQNGWFLLLIPIAIVISFQFSDLPWINQIRTLIPVLAVGLILISSFSKRLRSKKLKQSGISASAEILEAKETGMYDNRYNPQIKLYLRIMSEHIPVYETQFSGYFSKMELHKLQKGNIIWIKYDPNNPKKVIVDSD